MMRHHPYHPSLCHCTACNRIRLANAFIAAAPRAFGVQPPKPWPRGVPEWQPDPNMPPSSYPPMPKLSSLNHDDGEDKGRPKTMHDQLVRELTDSEDARRSLNRALDAAARRNDALLKENDGLKQDIDRLRNRWVRSIEVAKRDFNRYAQHRGACPGTPCECGLTQLRARRGYDL